MKHVFDSLTLADETETNETNYESKWAREESEKEIERRWIWIWSILNEIDRNITTPLYATSLIWLAN